MLKDVIWHWDYWLRGATAISRTSWPDKRGGEQVGIAIGVRQWLARSIRLRVNTSSDRFLHSTLLKMVAEYAPISQEGSNFCKKTAK